MFGPHSLAALGEASLSGKPAECEVSAFRTGLDHLGVEICQDHTTGGNLDRLALACDAFPVHDLRHVALGRWAVLLVPQKRDEPERERVEDESRADTHSAGCALVRGLRCGLHWTGDRS